MDVALVLIFATALLSMAVDAFSRWLRALLRIDPLPVHLSAADAD
jgi:phosphonate transport system permease protein